MGYAQGCLEAAFSNLPLCWGQKSFLYVRSSKCRAMVHGAWCMVHGAAEQKLAAVDHRVSLWPLITGRAS